MPELHLYTNDVDTFVACSEQDALAAFGEFCGWEPGDPDFEQQADTFERIPDDKIIEVDFVDGEVRDIDLGGLERTDIVGERFKVKTTAGDWAKRCARGMLCSTEY